MSMEFPEVREHSAPVPSRVAFRLPGVKGGLCVEYHFCLVNCTRSAEYFTALMRDLAVVQFFLNLSLVKKKLLPSSGLRVTYLWNSEKTPIVIWIIVQCACEPRRQNLKIVEPVGASFENQDLGFGVFGKTVCEDKTSSPAANDYKVIGGA